MKAHELLRRFLNSVKSQPDMAPVGSRKMEDTSRHSTLSQSDRVARKSKNQAAAKSRRTNRGK